MNLFGKEFSKPELMIILLGIAVAIVLIAIAAKKIAAKWNRHQKRVKDAQRIERELTSGGASLDNDLEQLMLDYPEITTEFCGNQMPYNDGRRSAETRTSDAVSFMLMNGNQGEIFEEIMRSPVFGDMVARGLMTIAIGKDKTLGSENPWLKDFVRKMDIAHARTERPIGNELWLKKNNDGKLEVTTEYRRYAARICTLLMRFQWIGRYKNVEVIDTYHLNSSTLGSRRRTEKVEGPLRSCQDALILQYLQDGVPAPQSVGFSAKDKRFLRIDSAKLRATK